VPLILKAANDDAELLIYDTIGADWWGDGLTAKQFDKDLKALGSPKRISVRINSGGGDVFDGLAIYNTLARHAARKTVYVDGLAASAASVIAMAGDDIRMGDGTFLMIHNAWGLAIGNAGEMRRTADLLDSISGQLAEVYVKRTGRTLADVRRMMDAETWMEPKTAIAEGFADRMSDDVVKAAASVDLSRFRNVPAALRRSSAAGPKLAALRARVAART
jgi:ATP-dependent protease ClpP protease subunit